MSVDDEIALLAADIRRYCNNDGRIDEALTQMLKLFQSEVDALAFEAADLKRLVVGTTARENARIRDASHRQSVTWQERKRG